MLSAAHHAASPSSRLVALAMLALALSGCDALRGAGELEQAIAREQAAITAYSADVSKVDGLGHTFAAALARANAHRDARVFREDLAAHAQPAGEAWVDGLRAMGGRESVELQAIHAPLVGAAAALVGAVERLASRADATPEALAAGQREIEAALAAHRAAEATYAEALAIHCARNRATLVRAAAVPLEVPPEAASDEAAPDAVGAPDGAN
jgi:hypothetical protein